MLLPTFFGNLMDWKNQWDFPILLFLALGGIFLFTWYVLIFFKTNDNSKLPPGPPGLPLIGNLLSLDPELTKYFTTLSQTYGPIFSIQFGAKYGVVVSSPSMAREVLKDNDVIFANHDVPAAARVVTYGGCDVVFSPYGSQWKMLRKAIFQWVSSSNTMDSVCKLRHKEIQKTVGHIYSQVGSPVDIGELMFLTVLNMNKNAICGGTEEEDEDTSIGGEFREVVAHIMELIGKPNLSDLFPWLAWLDLQGVVRQMRLVVQKFDHILEKMIKLRLKKKAFGGSNVEENQGFLEFLFKLKDELKDSKTPLTMANIKSLLVDLMIGGTDTSSNTIEFALAHIINEPTVLKRVQEELDFVVGKNNMVDESHIQKLPYLLAVMKETLRLHPIIPLLIPHCPSETTNVGGYTIPKGSRVFVNVWAIHRDPSIWESPLQFDPTRFLDGQNDYKENCFNYLPFGSGRRICAGMTMAKSTFLLCVATLIHLYEWRVPHNHKLDTHEKFGLTLKTKMPLIAIPTPRFSNQEVYK